MASYNVARVRYDASEKGRAARARYNASAKGRARTARAREANANRERWRHMVGRCLNATHPAFKNYGGRGVYVDIRWFSFKQFDADVGPPPAGKSIDRRDNDGPYSPENCRWATAKEQTNNRRI